VSNVVRDFYQIGALGMFVTLSLVVSVVAPLVVVIAALLRAPEAYENERGLQIIQKRFPQVEGVALAKKLTQGLHLDSATAANIDGSKECNVSRHGADFDAREAA
jgi:heme exporter protein D